jgi:type IV pilus assembly protein PilB
MSDAPIVRLAEIKIDNDAARFLGYDYAVKYLALPISIHGSTLKVAMCEEESFDNISILTDITGKMIEPVIVEEEDLKFHINKLYSEDEIDSIESRFLLKVSEGRDTEFTEEHVVKEAPITPTVQMIDALLESAVLERASDIHIEPYKGRLRARFRVDGRLVTFSKVDISLHQNIVSRLKVIGGMDISETRIPQDGAFTKTVCERRMDFRLSTLPTTEGEKAVVRLLYEKETRFKKYELGFFEDDLNRITTLFTRPYGAIFITGPTGSGKSTTLNCFLEELNDDTKNIVTVEDPVENPLSGISHVNVDPHALTFASALRHILRQDPDIIMIGEIRDEETARIAISAAITGHVVLSTLHTNDAAGVIERLSDMGIEPYFIAAALNGIISQRLVRRICTECSAEATLEPQDARILGIPPDTSVRCAVGCVHCNFSGFYSRFAIYEYIFMTEETRRQMVANPAEFAADIRNRNNLKKNAIRSLLAGFTTAEEIIRALNRDGYE